ncbi:MAG: hypothetical protein JEZ06_18030 [Anaerolineaceae bacterium]|nr:hypothetical protein [Anaerolineaceae bacterium]
MIAIKRAFLILLFLFITFMISSCENGALNTLASNICWARGGKWDVYNRKCVYPEDEGKIDTVIDPIPVGAEAVSEDGTGSEGEEPLQLSGQEDETGAEDEVPLQLAEEEGAPEEAQQSLELEEENIGIGSDALVFAGTYSGTTTIGDIWMGFWGGEVVSDEITVVIDENGNVSGSLASIWSSGRADPIKWQEDGKGPLRYCVSEITITETGSISGTISGVNDSVLFHLDQNKEIYRDDCPAETEVQTDSGEQSASIQISDGVIMGMVPDFFTFEAIIQ